MSAPVSPKPTRSRPIRGVDPNPTTEIGRMHTELKRSEQGMNEFNMRIEGCRHPPHQPMFTEELHNYIAHLHANIQNLKRAIIWERQFDDKLEEAGQPANRHALKIQQWEDMRRKCKALLARYGPMLRPTARAQHVDKRGQAREYDDESDLEGTPRALDFDEENKPPNPDQ
jgi:hypothetical protein